MCRARGRIGSTRDPTGRVGSRRARRAVTHPLRLRARAVTAVPTRQKANVDAQIVSNISQTQSVLETVEYGFTRLLLSPDTKRFEHPCTFPPDRSPSVCSVCWSRYTEPRTAHAYNRDTYHLSCQQRTHPRQRGALGTPLVGRCHIGQLQPTTTTPSTHAPSTHGGAEPTQSNLDSADSCQVKNKG